MRVTIFGSGYVGLVTGACLADAGNHVVCFDVGAAKIERLSRGDVPIHEPGRHGLFQVIAVGTPPDEDGSADLRQVLAVARTIGTHMNRFSIGSTRPRRPWARPTRRD